jgi:Co/Zn/Cd efflux system component
MDLLKFKLLHGILSAIITFIIATYIYVPTVQVFLNQDEFKSTTTLLLSTTHTLTLLTIIILSILLFRKKRQSISQNPI